MEPAHREGGPRPVSGAELSLARGRILRLLRSSDRAWTVADVAAHTGNHPNTVREHLEALVADGLAHVATKTSERRGRGRPPAKFRAASAWETGITGDQLVGALLREIAERGDADAIAERAGRRWGDELLAERPAELGESDFFEAMTGLGFDPEPDADDDRLLILRACPLRSVAEHEPSLVCGVHLGVVRALVGESEPLELLPMAHPRGCVLRRGS
ncbi:helix-turn-helix transcriptional regulator [Nigerium massiliense]|uniref:helix-turn-helix transcriptional regulator n=1 Tax=Nigerium massiliense TaxID=1522317 RepID=UPI0009078F86|nr:helix-turn-helix domain-containing protein [Nigerium massiliense]